MKRTVRPNFSNKIMEDLERLRNQNKSKQEQIESKETSQQNTISLQPDISKSPEKEK